MADWESSFGGFASGIAAVGNFFRGISSAMKRALAGLTLQIITLAKTTGKVFVKVGGYLANSAGFFNQIYRHLLRPMVAHLHQWAVLLASKLREWFGPVVRLLLKYRKRLLDLWNKHVRPILDVVDIVRRVFRIAGRLHVPGAAAIDKKIGRVEAKITGAFTEVIGKINEVLGWVNRIVTVDGILSEVILLTSIDHWKRQVLGIGMRGVMRPPTPDEEEKYRRPAELVTDRHYTEGLSRAMFDEESRVRTLGLAWADKVLSRIESRA